MRSSSILLQEPARPPDVFLTLRTCTSLAHLAQPAVPGVIPVCLHSLNGLIPGPCCRLLDSGVFCLLWVLEASENAEKAMAPLWTW